MTWKVLINVLLSFIIITIIIIIIIIIIKLIENKSTFYFSINSRLDVNQANMSKNGNVIDTRHYFGIFFKTKKLLIN